MKKLMAAARRTQSWPMTRYCAFVGAIGIGLLIAGAAFVGSTGWGKDLFVPGATLLTVALTGYVAAKSVVTWAEQRERDRESAEYKHREAVYEEIVTFMLAQFGIGGYNREKDVQLRAKAALWGSAETVQALSNWQSALSVIVSSRAKGANGATSLFPLEQATLKALFGAALMAMRKDLAPSAAGLLPGIDNILDSMFND